MANFLLVSWTHSALPAAAMSPPGFPLCCPQDLCTSDADCVSNGQDAECWECSGTPKSCSKRTSQSGFVECTTDAGDPGYCDDTAHCVPPPVRLSRSGKENGSGVVEV